MPELPRRTRWKIKIRDLPARAWWRASKPFKARGLAISQRDMFAAMREAHAHILGQGLKSHAAFDYLYAKGEELVKSKLMDSAGLGPEEKARLSLALGGRSEFPNEKLFNEFVNGRGKENALEVLQKIMLETTKLRPFAEEAGKKFRERLRRKRRDKSIDYSNEEYAVGDMIWNPLTQMVSILDMKIAEFEGKPLV